MLMKTTIKRLAASLAVSLMCISAFCQQRGHFLLGGGTSCIIGSGSADNPSNLIYTLGRIPQRYDFLRGRKAV